MIDLNDLNDHLSTLSYDDWKPLFDLIPIIEAAHGFAELVGVNKSIDGNTLPYVENGPIIDQFLSISERLDIIPVFDWPNWVEGKILFNNRNADFSYLSIIELCKFLTVVIRSDRFIDGNLAACFEDGTILKVLNAMKAHVIHS